MKGHGSHAHGLWALPESQLPRTVQQGAEGALPGPNVCWLEVSGHKGHEVGRYRVLHVEVVDALLLHVHAPRRTHQHLDP